MNASSIGDQGIIRNMCSIEIESMGLFSSFSEPYGVYLTENVSNIPIRHNCLESQRWLHIPHTKDHGEEFRRRQNKTLCRGSYFDAIAWPERGFQRKRFGEFPAGLR
jgi:hypothetical protein